MATITLKIVAAEMRDYNRLVAPGSECAAWQDFVADCFRRYDVAPWEDAAEEIEPVQDGVNYWLVSPATKITSTTRKRALAWKFDRSWRQSSVLMW